jgi:hypothetical protein
MVDIWLFPLSISNARDAKLYKQGIQRNARNEEFRGAKLLAVNPTAQNVKSSE